MTPLLSFYKGLKDHRISPCCVLGIIHEESSIISMYVYYVPDPLLKKMGICCEQGSAQQRFFCLGFMVMKPFFSDTCHCVEERTDLTMGLLIYTQHYVWLSQFWSHFCWTNALFAPKAKINVFLKFFERSCPEGASGVKKNFQKTLILAFEVIVQLPEYT